MNACSNSCVRATSNPRRCRCSGCGGRLHGVGRDKDAYLDGITEAKHRGYSRLSDLEVLASVA